MRARRRIAALLLVVTLALAGWSGGETPAPTTADPATATTTAATDRAEVEVRGGDPPVDETVALLVRNPAFVENATVSGSSANVTVSVAE